jgi:hypothetical protein
MTSASAARNEDNAARHYSNAHGPATVTTTISEANSLALSAPGHAYTPSACWSQVVVWGCAFKRCAAATPQQQLRFMDFALASALRAGVAQDRILNFMSMSAAELRNWDKAVRGFLICELGTGYSGARDTFCTAVCFVSGFVPYHARRLAINRDSLLGRVGKVNK